MVTRGAQLGVIVLFAAIGALVAVGLGSAFGNGDEVIYAENLREMRTTGDWGTLTWQGQPTLQRPTTAFLPALALSSAVSGEFGLRLFGGICLMLTLLLTYRAARWMGLGRSLSASTVLFAVSFPGLFFFGRALLSDPPFVVATTAALWASLAVMRGQSKALVLVGASLGLAIAFKSLAAAVPMAVLGPWLILRIRRDFDGRVVLASIAALLALALPYYLYSFSKHGSVFLEQHFGWNLVERATGGIDVGLPGGVFAYLAYLWQSEGPMAFVILFGGSGLAIHAGRANARPEWVLVGAFGPVALVLYSLIGTRLPHYLLPIYPAAALSAGVSCAYWIERFGGRLAHHGIVVAAALMSFAISVTRPPDEHLLTSGHSHRLGLTARSVDGVADHDPLYTYEWYAPAVAYYAHRPWVQLTESKQLLALMESIPFLRDARATRLVPPWPRPGHAFLLATPRALAERVPWPKREIAGAGDFVLFVVDP